MILSGGVQMSGNGKRRSYDRAFKVEAVRLVVKSVYQKILAVDFDHFIDAGLLFAL